MALTVESLADLVNTTLRQLYKKRATDLLSSFRKFAAFPAMRREGRNMISSDGAGHQFNIQHGPARGARRTGMYQRDNTLSRDTMVPPAFVPWRFNDTSYGFDIREPELNRGESQIVDHVLRKRHEAWVAMAELMEIDFWDLPTGTTDTEKPFGVPYWIVQSATNSTEADDGLTGGNPPNFSAGAGGVSSSTYKQWANVNLVYTDPTFQDLVAQMSFAYYLCDFEPPVEELPDYNTGDTYAIYTQYQNVLQPMERLLTTQNDNLGNSLNSKDGMVQFGGVKVKACTQLTRTTTTAYSGGPTIAASKPVYFINWGTFKPVFLQGWFLKDSGIRPQFDAHNSVKAFVDNMYNFICFDRRKNAVVHTTG